MLGHRALIHLFVRVRQSCSIHELCAGNVGFRASGSVLIKNDIGRIVKPVRTCFGGTSFENSSFPPLLGFLTLTRCVNISNGASIYQAQYRLPRSLMGFGQDVCSSTLSTIYNETKKKYRYPACHPAAPTGFLDRTKSCLATTTITKFSFEMGERSSSNKPSSNPRN